MEAVFFLEEKKRMCDSFKDSCKECGLEKNCLELYSMTEEEIVAVVEKWSKEHPVKTNGMVLFENFPSLNLVSHVLDYIEPKIILTEEWLNQPYVEPKE